MVIDQLSVHAPSTVSRRSLLGGRVGLTAFVPLGGCSGDPTYDDLARHPRAPATIVSLRRTGWYPAAASRIVLGLAKVTPDVPVEHDFTPYRLAYWSSTNGSPCLASALVSIPNVRPVRGVVLWMHGTNADRSTSISVPSLQEGVAISAAFAGGGYVVVAPDLIGLGISKLVQAYLYNPSTLSVTNDLLTILAGGLGGLVPATPGNVLVAGFSQGGHDAAVIHRDLEANQRLPFRVRATASVAGAYDLAGLSIPFALQGKSAGSSVYLGLAALSWSAYYGKPLDTLLTVPAAERLRRALDGAHASELHAMLPRSPRNMFRSDFLQAVDTGGPHWFLDAARANEAGNWTPRAPYRAYYGANDVDVTPQESLRFAQAARGRGADVVAVPVGPYGHGESALHAVPLIRKWFDELS